MNFIAKQSAAQSLIHWSGVGLGALSVLLLYPRDLELYGLIRFLIDASIFLAPFVFLGADALVVRFFPLFQQDSSNDQGLKWVGLRYALLGLLIFSICYFLGVQDWVQNYFNGREALLRDYNHFVYPISILYALSLLIYNYISNFQKIAVPYLFTNLIRKIWVPILFIGFIAGAFDYQTVVAGLILMFVIAVLGLIVYQIIIGQFSFKRINKKLYQNHKKEIRKYTLLGFAGGVGASVALSIDTIMVGSLVGLEAAGTYAIGLFVANAISAPITAIGAISGPVIAKAWSDNNKEKIKKIYYQSSHNLLAIGLVLFLLALLNINALTALMPTDNDLSVLFSVVLFLGLSQVFNMLGSVSNQIINYSQDYVFNIVATLILAFVNILANYYFIKVIGMGMLGAALATSISLFGFNFFKVAFIYFKFGMQPVTRKTLTLLLIGVLSFFFPYLIPSNGSAYFLQICWQSTLFILVYATLLFATGVVPIFNTFIRDKKQKLWN